MKKQGIRILVLVLAMAMLLGITACGQTETTTAPTIAPTTTAPTTTVPIDDTPLVVGYLQFSEKFSPFFADTGYDMDAVSMTAAALLTTDRQGGIVYNAIEGETIEYNGTPYKYTGIANVKVEYDETADKTVYTWTIRDDVKFSDGELMTADDIIFSYYVYADPSYSGSTTLYSVPIIGINDYRTQTTSEVYEKYEAMAQAILEAGPDHVWAATDSWTQEIQDYFWVEIEKEWKKDLEAIVAYVDANYKAAYAEDYTGFKADEITDDLKVMLAMALWGFGEVEEKVLTTAVLGKTFDLNAAQYPTIDDFYAEAVEAYAGDPVEYSGVESIDDSTVYDVVKSTFIGYWGPKDSSMGGTGIPNIEGIKKVNDTTVTVTVDGFDATAIYSLGITVSPLHYYGNESMYDYAANKFGFPYGDLSGIAAKTTQPVGAGPYRFIKYENKIVYYEANTNYFKGQPKTYYVQFKETTDADKISGIGTGTIDLTDPSFNTAAVEEIKGYNSNGETTGDKLVTVTVDNLGYGYVGLNADTVRVGNDSGSDASKNLRKGIATILAAYRDLTVDSYYGERASVINYPISNTSWAAPQKTDADYKVAFSTGVDGKDIFTSAMTAEQKYEAAIDAAVLYFKAAGYTFDEASGKLTAAPEGAKLEYVAIVPGGGAGDHPSFMLLTEAKKAFEQIGINLIINDPANSNELWDALDAGTQEIWCAAWGATIDPDMYQVYHSSNIVGLPGSSESNHYHIADSELDNLIMDARKSDDQSYRKATYKACLDLIIDWAVEIPIYQRQNCFLFSNERIDMSTVTPDITTFWGWLNEVETIVMK